MADLPHDVRALHGVAREERLHGEHRRVDLEVNLHDVQLRHGRGQVAHEDGRHHEGGDKHEDGEDALADVERPDLVHAAGELRHGPVQQRRVPVAKRKRKWS